MKRVVVTGCGVVSPVGIGRDTFFDSLANGRSGIEAITQMDADGFSSRIAGEVKDYEPLSDLSVKDIRKTPRFVQLALTAAQEAFDESGLDISKEDPYSIGVIFGSGIGSIGTLENETIKWHIGGPRKISPFLIPMLIVNEAAGGIAIRLGLKGVNYCPVTACASGTHAIGEAFEAIKCGRAKAMVCGGTEAAITPLGIGGFCALKALSTRNDEPQKASRPFDKDRNGFVMAEGAGAVILEEYEHAKQRGAFIYAEVVGYGATCDAYHITAPDASGIPASEAMLIALRESGLDMSSSFYVNAHGTSTQLNDKMETAAMKLAFGSTAKDIKISSTKSMTGHMLGAAGGVEFIACCLAIKNELIPPTINYETPDPECDLFYTPNEALKIKVDAAMSNSLGFGGHNASVLIKRI
ncbi:MAG: beta-ketoacyl-ACP synthase II [Candidatus Omnitrophota bacterium]|jgi:3-oxoacyl-[acyl-carrier-protein] synthase II|nr:beta-ketoacyl-ACP synthase II [Candidatus Omnitrophota bacterium]